MAEKTEGGSQPPAYPGGVIDPAMPTTYDTPPPTYTQPAPTTINQTWFISADGIFTGAEWLLSFLVFVCAAADRYFAAWSGGGWVIFVGVITWLIQTGIFIFHPLRLNERIPESVPVDIIEMIYLGVASFLMLIAGSVASSRFQQSAAVGASSMFCWFALVVYGVDAIRRFMYLRSTNQLNMPTVTHTTNTTTTTTTTTSQGDSRTITTEPTY